MNIKSILVFTMLVSISATKLFSQTELSDTSIVNYANPKQYEIGGITITGTQYLDIGILQTISGLTVGSEIEIPGTDIGDAIQKLWKQKLFADVSIYVTKVVGSTVFLEIRCVEKPRLSAYTFRGIKKGEQDDLREKMKLIKNMVLTDNVKMNVETITKDYFANKGYNHIKVTVEEKPDSSVKNGNLMYIYVDKGQRVKIDEINFNGNTNVKDGRLKMLLKKTKENDWWSILNTSKYSETDFKDDLVKAVHFYNTKGYRDAVISLDTMFENADGNLVMNINVNEGNKYYFRNITWSGNTKYSSGILDTILRIKKGDIYNEENLNKRLQADPNQNDISSLYMDDGYLFFQITPVELQVVNDSIDLEIRLYEGPQATINNVVITGNTKTHEKVLRRAIRTVPGQKFSRSDVIRSQREIATLGFFDPEKIGIVPTPHPESGTVDINYSVEEKPSDQVELSAGFGGYGVVGSLGVSLNNFSTRNMFKKGGWKPIPMGDGQKLSVRVQSNGKYYQSYNFSFTEPWLGGKKPNSLSIGVYRSNVTNGLPKDNASSYRFLTNGGSIGLGKQLKFPDDFFNFIGSIDFQNYNLHNYPSFIISNGTANNLSVKLNLIRNSLSDFTFPRSGSNISFTAQFTPPYSLFNNKDYSTLTTEEKFKWIEYHKYRFQAEWYTPLFSKFVLRTSVKMGFLGYYNSNVGLSPFERFELGGDGISNYSLYGKDIIALRGYEVSDVMGSNTGGAPLFNKYSLELRYPFSTNPSAFIYGLAFVEGGNAWNYFRDYNPFDLKRSAGMGLRIYLPMFGILGFDYGVGFDKNIETQAGLGKYLSAYGRFSIVLGFEPE